jgi:glycosyltransferase involved in cell wall biosynthesis
VAEAPVTVLHLSSSSGPGGAETVMASIAAGLDRSRYRSIVCLFRDGWLRRRCERLGLETHVLNINGMFDVGWLTRFTRLLRDRDVRLVHTHEFGANTYGTLGARVAGLPVVATVHGQSYYADCVRRRWAYRLVSHAAVMVAVSDDVKRFIVERTGVAAERIRVIHNGIGAAETVSAEAGAHLRDALGLGETDRIVTAVGSLYPVKGHDVLIDAAPSILAACPSTVFLVAGRGDRESALRAQARRLGIDGRVHFLGLRHDVPDILAITDVFVLPSMSEGLSVALLEAMAAARPVVATRVGGNSELVESGRSGLLVPCGDAPALATAVIDLLTHRDKARALGQRGLTRVTTRFAITAMIEQYATIYESAMRREAARPPSAAIASTGRIGAAG